MGTTERHLVENSRDGNDTVTERHLVDTGGDEDAAADRREGCNAADVGCNEGSEVKPCPILSTHPTDLGLQSTSTDAFELLEAVDYATSSISDVDMEDGLLEGRPGEGL